MACSNELKPIPIDEQSKKNNVTPDGEKGGNCFEGKTCNEGLICSFNNICAVPPQQVGSNSNIIDNQDEPSSVQHADDVSDSFSEYDGGNQPSSTVQDDNDTSSCENGKNKNACGGCADLIGDPGANCGGICNTAVYLCQPDGESLDCVDPLAGEIEVGTKCGICNSGIYQCNVDNTGTECIDPLINKPKPSSSCGGLCGTAKNECNADGSAIVCVDPLKNAVQVGTKCGICNSGSYQCKSDKSGTICQDPLANAMKVGTICGQCDTGSYQCNSNNSDTSCVDPFANEALKGSSCGICGTYQCKSDNSAMECADACVDPYNISDHLLLSEIRVTPTDGEFIEIYNPTSSSVNLENYWIASMNYNDPTPTPTDDTRWYYQITTTTNFTSMPNDDFIIRFPANAVIGAGEYITIGMKGSAKFNTAYGFFPDYIIPASDTDAGGTKMSGYTTSNMGNAGLTNDGEEVILFYWDNVSPLVQDIDYVIWGSKKEACDKTGISVNGSQYLSDTAITQQEVIKSSAHDNLKSFQRMWNSEGIEKKSNGNGLTQHDETSEPFSKTWTYSELPSPGFGL